MEMPEPDEPASQRRKKRVRDEDACLVDPVVKIVPPGFEYKGETYPSREVQVLLFGVKSKDLWIELSHKNIAYMRALVQKGEGQVPTRKKRASPKKRLKRMTP